MEHHAVPLQPTWSVVYPIFFRPGARLFRPPARLTCLIAAAFHFHFDTSNFKTVMDENEESCTFEILPVVLYMCIFYLVSPFFKTIYRYNTQSFVNLIHDLILKLGWHLFHIYLYEYVLYIKYIMQCIKAC